MAAKIHRVSPSREIRRTGYELVCVLDASLVEIRTALRGKHEVGILLLGPHADNYIPILRLMKAVNLDRRRALGEGSQW